MTLTDDEMMEDIHRMWWEGEITHHEACMLIEEWLSPA